MSSGFKRWIWYATHSKSSFSGDRLRERISQGQINEWDEKRPYLT